MTDERRSRPVRRGSITGALILIVLGLVLTLYNLGYLPGEVWYSLWRFWPVILILVGLDIALRRFPTWFALPLLLLTVIVAVGAALLVAPTLPQQQIVTQKFSQDLADLDQAQVRLEIDRGTLRVRSSDDQSLRLFRGHFAHSNSITIDQEFDATAGTATVSLADRYEAFFPFFLLPGGTTNEWAVELTPVIPLALHLDADDSQIEVSLTELLLQEITAELVDSSGEIALSSSDALNASLNLDDSELTVSIPANVAARVELNLDDTELFVDSSRFTKISEDQYLSADYDELEIRIDLSITATDSSLSIQ